MHEMCMQHQFPLLVPAGCVQGLVALWKKSPPNKCALLRGNGKQNPPDFTAVVCGITDVMKSGSTGIQATLSVFPRHLSSRETQIGTITLFMHICLCTGAFD